MSEHNKEAEDEVRAWFSSSPAQEVEKPDFKSEVDRYIIFLGWDLVGTAEVNDMRRLGQWLYKDYISPLLKENQSLKERIKFLEAENEELRKKTTPTFTSDMLPPENEHVLCYNGWVWIENSWMQHTDQDAEWFRETFIIWQPLPSKPKN